MYDVQLLSITRDLDTLDGFSPDFISDSIPKKLMIMLCMREGPRPTKAKKQELSYFHVTFVSTLC